MLTAIECVTIVSLALVTVGLFTRTMSWISASSMMLASGLTYSYGKIDHYILLVIVPLFGAWAGWGDSASVDSVLRRRKTVPRAGATRLFAIAIGVAFATAGLQKLAGGWLSPSTQAAQGQFLVEYLFKDKTAWLARAAYDVRVPALWELLDWATVGLELGLVVATLRWRWFTAGLALALLFHVGILVTLNIAFSANVVAYGFFVAWSFVLREPFRVLEPLMRWLRRLPRSVWGAAAGVFVVGGSAGALALGGLWEPDGPQVLSTLVVFAGGLFAIAYGTWTIRGRPTTRSTT